MKKWLIGAVVVGALGYVGYDFSQSPYRGAPEIAEGEFLMVFGEDGDGLKGVMTGIVDERHKRRYFSYDAKDVPDWYLQSWSTCRPPLDDERKTFLSNMDLGPGGRLDAICELDADGDVFIRGWVGSVPDI